MSPLSRNIGPRMVWEKLRARLPSLSFTVPRRRKTVILDMPAHLIEDVWGLPGDIPPDFPKTLSTISLVMDKIGVRWCVVGDVLFAHYRVPKVTIEIEVCILSEDLRKVQEAFLAEDTFCFPYRPPKSVYNDHLAKHPRFRVKGMRVCFFLVPHHHYGLDPLDFDDIWIHPNVHIPAPLIPLPHYVRGLASLAIRSDIDNLSFRVQLEFLIDGMDIDEEWCRNYLDGPSRDFVTERSTPHGKKERMGSHPKYDGNITTYIRNEEERSIVLTVKGRVLENRGHTPSVPSNTTWIVC